MKNLGFILFDDTNEGVLTLYNRSGVNQLWVWGLNTNNVRQLAEDDLDYQFTVEPDGGGRYYDFTGVEKGKSTKPDSVYKCKSR